jgi:ATP-dependent DNA helicase RecQ
MADRLQLVVCTTAFGVGINKPNTRWVIHYHAPCTLSEYVQEVGRAGRDGEPAEALTLVSEPTGWLDPSDRQRAQFFHRQTLVLRHKAEQLVHQIPPTGKVEEVSQRFSHGAIALAWLHSTGQLEWLDPFRYRLRSGPSRPPALQTSASQQMHRFFHSRQCRWQALLIAFGFTAEARRLEACGHCDNC